MRKFIYNISLFVIILLSPIIIGIILPATPRASTSLIFSNRMKDSLMNYEKSPRVIFVGGSNLSFGLNCQIVKDSLNINPINTAIHASIGLKYMMANSLQYIRAKDLVVLVPEYQQFQGDFSYGEVGEELTRTIFDVNISKIRLLNYKQLINVIKVLPKYSLSKYYSNEYKNIKVDDIYSVNSFNKYGDAYKHWGLKKIKFQPFTKTKKNINQLVFSDIKDFEAEINKKHAVLFISYPSIQDMSFQNTREDIKEVEKYFKKNNFNILGTPERYMVPDSMIFNTPYHLLKKGVDWRTNLIVSDIKAKLGNRTNLMPHSNCPPNRNLPGEN